MRRTFLWFFLAASLARPAAAGGAGLAAGGGGREPERAVAAPSGAETSAPRANPGGADEILSTRSYWRCHVTARPIPFGTQEDAKPHERGTRAIGFKMRKPTIPLDGPKTPFPPEPITSSRW